MCDGTVTTSVLACSVAPPDPHSPLLSHLVFENNSKIVIVMEYASKGDLYDYINERQRLTEQEARNFFRQVVSAVYYCHKVSERGRPPSLGGGRAPGPLPN